MPPKETKAARRARSGKTGSAASADSDEPEHKTAKGEDSRMHESEAEVFEPTPMPASFEAFLADQRARDLAFQQAAVDREKASTDRLEGVLKLFDQKFAATDTINAKFDATLVRMQNQLDAQAEATAKSFAALQLTPRVPDGWPAPGASASSGGLRPPPPAARAVGVARPVRGSADEADRTKVFFKGFPADIPKRILTTWFDSLYQKTDREPGLDRHIGANCSFAVSFPTAAGAKRFMDQVRDNSLSLEFFHRGSPIATIIKMEPQYRTSAFGKALSSVWKPFSAHIKATSSAAIPMELIVDTDRGRFRAEVGEDIHLLAFISNGTLELCDVGLTAIGFPAAARAEVIRSFVA
jgi:hypothetical protein